MTEVRRLAEFSQENQEKKIRKKKQKKTQICQKFTNFNNNCYVFIVTITRNSISVLLCRPMST